MPQYDSHQGQLDKHIETLRETLMDIEIKVQHALQEAVKSFTTKVEEINSILETLQKSTFDQVGQEVTAFKSRLLEEFKKEKESFEIRIEQEDDQAVLQEYPEEVHEILVDQENKEVIDELVSPFVEKVDGKI